MNNVRIDEFDSWLEDNQEALEIEFAEDGSDREHNYEFMDLAEDRYYEILENMILALLVIGSTYAKEQVT
jgi:hypothetical protein